MSNVIKKCRKDGLVYAAAYAGQCEQCFAELGFFCKVHNAWLTTERCDKCEGPSTVPSPALTAPPVAPRSKGDLWLVLFFIGCVVVMAGSVTVIWRIVARRKATPPPKPAVQSVAPPTVKVTPAPAKPAPPVVAPVKQPAPPVELSLSQILSDPDPYLGKLVQTHGSVQFLDTNKETFDLRQGDYVLQVRYHALLILAHDVTVAGVLRRDDSQNAIYISNATLVEKR